MERHIAVTPETCLDPGIAIAACRAKCTGIMDLGYHENEAAIRSAVHQLKSDAKSASRWGVRWSRALAGDNALEFLAEALPIRVPILVLAGVGRDAALANLQSTEHGRPLIRRIAHWILAEVYDVDDALAAQAAGCNGVILKGSEAGGWTSRQSSFILCQEVRKQLRIPYWIQGGIGLRSAPVVKMLGATGVVLGEQLWLADESPLRHCAEAALWGHLDGTETVLLGPPEAAFRVYERSGRQRIAQLQQAVLKNENWRQMLTEQLQAHEDPLIPMAQDIALAGTLAQRHCTVGRILSAIDANIGPAIEQAHSHAALSAKSTLAQAHGTRYPIVQGPMTRVSDVAPFAQSVVANGALPLIALSVMRKEQTREVLQQTRSLLGARPWGVGLLGFMPLAFRQEQLEVVREVKPPFALISGGRPGQARELEELGISTYLHVPSPGLLREFVQNGARKFVLEGGECGGHTGPLSSFILWEQAVEILSTVAIDDPESVQILFAGGIHDDWSAAAVAVMAAPLTALGMKVGVLMGTAYLFTREIVESGAVLQEFQAQAIACHETTLLQSGKGMYTRCAVTPFCDEFERTRRELLLALETPERVLKVLEVLNIGRLRIASKGIGHSTEEAATEKGHRYTQVSLDVQRREGMYMIGDVARLRHASVSIADLHAQVSAGSESVLAGAVRNSPRSGRPRRANPERDIAIVGMACALPGAPDMRSFWHNIINGVNAIREVSDDRWRPQDYYDSRRNTPDKVYSKWGGFLADIAFDPMSFGIPPASLRSIEPMQLLALESARLALADAGLDRRPFPRDRTATIFASGGMNDLGTIYIFRALLAHYLPQVPELSASQRDAVMASLYQNALPHWTEDSFAGILNNVVSGRIANRLDLQGSNFTVDAACASSLAALDVAIRQLRCRDADVAVVGAVDGTNNPVAYMCFAQTHALSPRGRCRPFDDSADGIALGEGVATLVLKRLVDAERDGDRIHALIKGIGSSSDGRNRSMTAPHPQGQIRALHRAYDDAGVDAASVGLIEAHGTGTALGDKTEIEALSMAFGDASMPPQTCAIGSVKSMIGHTKVAAGMASIVKTAQALQHRVLPPTIGVETPNRGIDFSSSPFFINAAPRPWFKDKHQPPRRAGVSAFGFGGTNFHVVLEEYGRDSFGNMSPRPAELLTFEAHSRDELRQELEQLHERLVHAELIDLGQLNYSLHLARRDASQTNGDGRRCRLALIANDTADLKTKLKTAVRALQDAGPDYQNPQGIYYADPAGSVGKICFLFPGQGSQRINMLADLVVSRPPLHGLFEHADHLLTHRLPQPLSRYIYPPPAFTAAQTQSQQAALNETQIAQPALAVADLSMLDLLAEFGLTPDFVAGHSFGEYVALHAAGVIDRDHLLSLAEIRGRLTAQAAQACPGAMAAINADEKEVSALLKRHNLDLHLANLNSAAQTIVAGSVAAVDEAVACLSSAERRVTKLPVSAAFHSPSMQSAAESLGAELSKVPFSAARIPVFSNSNAAAYPKTPDAMRALLVEHLTSPVRFADEIRALSAAGAHTFIEVGPGLTLTGLVDSILDNRPHHALGIDTPARAGWLQLAHLLGQLFAKGHPVSVDPWFADRGYRDMTPADVFAAAQTQAHPGPAVWRVNGGRAEPWHAPKTAPRAATPSDRSNAVQMPGAPSAAPKPWAEPTTDSTPTMGQSSIQESATMTSNSHATTGGSATPRAGAATTREAQAHQAIDQLLSLHRDQQDSFRRLLDFEARLVNANGIGQHPHEAAPHAFAPPADSPPVRLMQQSATHGTGSPPLPTLPLQVVALNAEAGHDQQTAPPRAASPSPEPSVAAPTISASNGPISADQFRQSLLSAVSERTGYPIEMLDMNAHMEADLGIDSIKRIEVLSKLKNVHDFLHGHDEEAMFEELTGFTTLQEIVTWFEQLNDPAAQAAGGNLPKKPQAPLPPVTTTVE